MDACITVVLGGWSLEMWEKKTPVITCCLSLSPCCTPEKKAVGLLAENGGVWTDIVQSVSIFIVWEMQNQKSCLDSREICEKGASSWRCPSEYENVPKGTHLLIGVV